MKYKDIQSLFKNSVNTYVDYIDNRLKQLNDLLMSTIDNGIKYLFLVNAGGCIGVISFYSADSNYIRMQWTWLVLGLFFLGLILVGYFYIERFKALNNMVKVFYKNSTDFYQNKIDFEKIIKDDSDLTTDLEWIRWIAYGSFVCIILAGAVSIYNVIFSQ